MVITIGREYGSGGKYIGERLAEDLGLKLYDKELLKKVAEESGMDLETLEEMDEKKEQSFWYTFAMSMYAQDSLETISEIPSNEKIEKCIITKNTVVDNAGPRIIENPDKTKKAKNERIVVEQKETA